MDRRLSHVFFVMAVLLVLIIVTSKIRREYFSGALPGIVGDLGQALLESGAIGTADEMPCIIAGMPMADGFRAPNSLQNDINLRSCVISTSIPDIAEACVDPDSSLHSSIVTGVQLVPSSDPMSMDCMVTFKSSLWDRTENDLSAVYNYNVANDWKMRQLLLQQANAALIATVNQLGHQVGTLTAINQSLEQNLLTTKSALSTTNTQLLATNSQLQNVNNKLSTTTMALGSAQNTINNTQNLLSLATQQNTTLSQTTQQQISTLTSNLQASMNTITQLAALRDSLQIELANEKSAKQTISSSAAATISSLVSQLQNLQAAAASAGPSVNYLPGLVIDVWHVKSLGGENFNFEYRKFTSYGTKLLDMDVVNFEQKDNDGRWCNDAWLGNQIGFDIYGFIEVPATSEYTFYMITDDGAQIWVDNIMLFDKWYRTGPVRHEAKISLRSGKVAIRMRWYEWYGTKVLRLGWDGPGTATMFTDKLVNLIPATSYYYVPPAFPITVPTPTTNDYSYWARLNAPGATRTAIVSNPPYLRTFDSTYCDSRSMTVSFWLQIYATNAAWRNILQVTKPNPNDGNKWYDGEHPGHRRPGIWIAPSHQSYLHISSSTATNVNDWTDTDNLPLNEKTLVVITYKDRTNVIYVYNRAMKYEKTRTFSSDIWPAQGSGYNVYMGTPHATSAWDCHNFAIRNLRFFNVAMKKEEVSKLYLQERLIVDVNSTAAGA